MGRKQSIAGPVPPPRLASKLRRALGLRQNFTVGGVRYKEHSTETLRSALSRRGAGRKVYDVSFRDGSRLTIECTRERTFADLAPPPNLPMLLRTERLLRPGMRVLVIPGGTGYSAAMIAGRVAPSGAVVAIEPDEQSVQYARHRYPIQNVSYEYGGVAEVRGEVDGSFDAVVAIDSRATPPDEQDVVELWRLVAPGGWLLVAHASPVPASGQDPSLQEVLGTICRSEFADHPDSTSHIGSLGDGRDGWIGAVAHREKFD